MARTRDLALWAGLVLAVVVLALSFSLPHLLDWDVASRAARSASPLAAPPLHGIFTPTWFGPGTVPAVLLALLGWRYAGALAERLSWGRLLVASYVASLAWLVSLAFVYGSDGISHSLGGRYEYLIEARKVTSLAAAHDMLTSYVDRIPIDSAGAWPTQLAGHPPGMVFVFIGLNAIGLGGGFAAGMVVTVVAASIALAVMVTLRALGAEDGARAAAPYLVLTPAAVFLAVSADAVITATVAWGLACLALAARRLWWAVPAGLLLGSAVMMSYGMLLAGVLALGVLVAARAWRPLPVAAVVALVPVGVFAGLGFSWLEAYPVLRERYYDGIASDRPSSYWAWANFGALLVSAGPMVFSGVAATAFRRVPRPVWVMTLAAALALLLADGSGMSKAEVERIWLPFIPWLTLGLVALPPSWRRPALAVQLVSALLVQHLFLTGW